MNIFTTLTLFVFIILLLYVVLKMLAKRQIRQLSINTTHLSSCKDSALLKVKVINKICKLISPIRSKLEETGALNYEGIAVFQNAKLFYLSPRLLSKAKPTIVKEIKIAEDVFGRKLDLKQSNKANGVRFVRGGLGYDIISLDKENTFLVTIPSIYNGSDCVVFYKNVAADKATNNNDCTPSQKTHNLNGTPSKANV